MPVVVVMFAPVAVAIVIPLVIVRHAAAIAFPVAFEPPRAIVMRRYPPGARVWRARPIPFMPMIAMPHRVPIAFNPNKIGTRSRRPDPHDPRRRWRADRNAHGNLGETTSSGKQQQRE